MGILAEGSLFAIVALGSVILVASITTEGSLTCVHSVRWLVMYPPGLRLAVVTWGESRGLNQHLQLFQSRGAISAVTLFRENL
ncbi:hypothetical protein B0J12DRAFT_686377 [Macrophomina phaseolina]|uniref:Secreted protein n=1 Tax=Macrophomina phaseolina TaxID=35725 RepID=A0ABQ8FT82_9PEZI|nr:hypothetical protein B0J12DRAFT_686377 [Macrophomina phaseolina]